MDLYTGEIKGKVTLDKSGFKQDVASVVRDATEAADKLTETLGKPFAPAAEEAGKLKQGLEAVAQQSAAAMQGASGLATALEAVASTPAKQSLQAIAQESSAAAQSAGGLQIALEKVASASVLPPATYGLKELQAEVQKTEVDTRRLPLALADVATASVKVTPAIYEFKQLDAAVEKATASTGRLRSAFASLPQLDEKLQPLLQPLGLLPGRIGAIASRVSSLSGTVSRAASAFASGGSGVIAQASGIAGSAGQATAGIAGMGTALGVLAGAAAVAAGPIGGFLIEQTRIAFTTMAGSAAIAKTTLADLQKFADTTPFQFPEVSQAAKQLLAMGFDAKEVTGELRMLGDVSSGLNQPLGEIAYLYGQVKSRGSASAMELREFAMRGIPIYNELAKVLGVSVEQVRKLTSEGSVGFDQIQAAFRSMTSEGGRFHDLTQKQAESLEGLQSTAADAYAAIQRDIGEVVTANLKLKQTTSDQIDLVNAIHPLAVGVIDDLTKKLDVFIDSYQSILKLTTELAKDASFLKGAFEDAFGKNFISNLETIQKYVNPLNLTIMAIKEAVDGVTWALKRARENLSAGAWLEGEGAAMDKANHQKITKQEVQDKIAKAGKSPAAKGAGITPAAESDTGGFGGGSSEGSGGGAGGRGAAGGMKEWHKTQELAWATYISNLRAAGQEAAARIAELDEKLQKDLAAAKTDDEVRAIRLADRAKREEANAKAQQDRSKALHESWTRANDVMIESQIRFLRASGKELEASLAEIANRYAKEIAKAGSPLERQALEAAKAADLAAAKKEAADKKARDDARTAAEEQKKAAEQQEKTDDYLAQARIAQLKLQGKTAEAELAAFDAEWQKRIARASTDLEKQAASGAYAAERALKVNELNPQAPGDTKGRGRPMARGNDLSTVSDTIEEAQRRVRTAKAGSGERELARLDLRDMVWNRDHPNVHYDPYAGDRARQKRLGERFGRVSAFSAIAPLVAPAQAGGHGASATAGHPPAVNIAPSVGIDVAQVSQAVTAATKKGVKEAMQQVVNQQRDRNYANGVGGQL